MTSLKRPPVFREDGIIEIPLTRGFVAIIDAVDAAQAEFLWFAMTVPGNLTYAVRNKRQRAGVIYLHRAILGLEDPKVLGDHLDGNTMDCRRQNLREATAAMNSRNIGMSRHNTSGYRGVSYHRRDKRWRAEIYIDGNRISIGAYATAAEANAARLAYEAAEWGIHPRRADAHK